MPSPDFDLPAIAKHPATAGLAGALLLSLRMAPGSSWWERISTFIGGALVAVYLAPAACEFLQIHGEKTVLFLSFAAGLFGLSLAHQLMEAVKRAPIGEFIAAWLQRKGGGQ
jgi:hypothetical protein